MWFYMYCIHWTVTVQFFVNCQHWQYCHFCHFCVSFWHCVMFHFDTAWYKDFWIKLLMRTLRTILPQMYGWLLFRIKEIVIVRYVILHCWLITKTLVETESRLKLLLKMVLPINLHNLGMYQSKGPIRWIYETTLPYLRHLTLLFEMK